MRSRDQSWTMRPIGHVRSSFRATEEIPRGCGAKHVAKGTLEILPRYEAGLQDIEGFSHLIVLWVFHRAGDCELVCVPPSDDRPHGVFGTRSPHRPNPIGLTVVRLMKRRGRKVEIQGVDMVDGTPILDIKPYLSSIPEGDLRRGWLAKAEERSRRRSKTACNSHTTHVILRPRRGRRISGTPAIVVP